MKKPPLYQAISIDFDLRQLEIFKEVVEHESFSKAAQKVCLAQASVSERIANLESAVGTKLLDRLGRQVVPTKAGKLLYKHANLLLDMKRAACLELQDFIGLKRGEIRMGGSTIPGEYILPKALRGFRERYPLITVTLTVGSTGDIEELVLDGNLELGVVGSMRKHRNLEYRELWEDELLLAVPAQHPWAEREEVTLEELSTEPFITREPGSGTLKFIEEYLRSVGLSSMEDLNVVAALGTSTAVKEGVKSGLGVSILSSRALETDLAVGILKGLRVKGLLMTRSFYLLMDKRREPSPLCRAMVEYLLGKS
ncbi:MAG: LysR family transcriptional regulator [Deltaproteobacteria bacterium]|nr:LysR family transcriptional regulator [Deltaproteobacteria bacterium]MBW2018092.1 LysR family transcriptional regulator [Deltaproteobacteria bacterium]MBW2129963.1 LysR family transcriptional regulator [Deltaproteobacteria bacterium]MBW2304252.1 LysR family transcriptional regulator [Deltaproteobacteria bacterium]